MVDETALEKAYNRGLFLEKCGDFEGAAAAYREALAIDPDDHGGAAIRLAAIGHGKVPQTAPKAYVTTLFDQHADVFDMILVDQLGYDVPLQLREQLLQYTDGKRVFSRLLDLGCGTGLSADALNDLAQEKNGVDISENIVAIAHEKLELFFSLVSKHLESEGIFGFSSETLDARTFNGKGFTVGPHQRFAHREDYIRNCLDNAGLSIADCHNIVVRAENGIPVTGQLFLARHSL